MKTEGQIKQKYKQVKFRARASAMGSFLEPRPSNCIFGEEVSSSSDPQRVMACNFGEVSGEKDWDVSICTLNCSRSCPKFAEVRSPKQFKRHFNALLKYSEETGDLGPLASAYPDLAALLWVMDLQNVSEEFEEPTAEEPTAEEPTVEEPTAEFEEPTAEVLSVSSTEDLQAETKFPDLSYLEESIGDGRPWFKVGVVFGAACVFLCLFLWL